MATYRRANRRLSGLGESLGYKVWEWLNPEQHAREYTEAQGREAPPPVGFDDVLYTARENTLEVAREAGEHLTEGFTLAKKALVIGAVLYGFHLLTKWKGKR